MMNHAADALTLTEELNIIRASRVDEIAVIAKAIRAESNYTITYREAIERARKVAR